MTQPANTIRQPFVGQTVHYQSYGTPGGEYLPEPRAAIITEVKELDPVPEHGIPYVSLCVVNPTGLFFKEDLPFAETPTPGHWNYMPRTEAGDAVQTLVDDFCAVTQLGTVNVTCETPPCAKCEGCGQVANDDDESPWTAWASLPPGSDLAVRTGLVRPVTCPDCLGTGKRGNA
ncbi:hypothetical protein [Prescottella equi]|uniref:hypothetical protein n=1 Tax=Rhodococcus hoagii TaxID=43767 RepID=UPI00191C6F7A|nr:hypothetical protein [Prescottella equi]